MCGKMLRQIRVAVIGLPDGGKSTFIKGAVRMLTGKEVSPDTLMKEVHYSDGRDPYGNPDTRTIKCAKIFFKYKEYEICLYDCPGHIEYIDQIKQGIDDSSFIIELIDSCRWEKSKEYLDYLYNSTNILSKKKITLMSHSYYLPSWKYYNIGLDSKFNITVHKIFNRIIWMARFGIIKSVDIEKEAIELIKKTLPNFHNIGMFFSAGKDSLVGLKLVELARFKNYIRIFFPNSGEDFPEVKRQLQYYKELFKVPIYSFSNNYGTKPDECDSFTWMKFKASSNNNLIKKYRLDLVLVQFRASDEGVRSKDYYICNKENHFRFSPVFYFSEDNIWRFIRKYKLPVCELYYKGYRSLGDKHLTEPCMPYANSISDIIKYIEDNPKTSERDGRTKQDNSESFAMEKLRNGGFF